MYPTKIVTAITLLFVLSLFSCKNDKYPENPEDVLKIYLEKANQNKPGESYKYVTKNSKGLLEMIEKNAGPTTTSNRGTAADMRIDKADIKGNKAIVSSYNKKTNMLSYFILLKEEGKWKVSLDKESIMETTKLVLNHYGVNIADLQSGKISRDSAQKIMENYQRLHPNGE